MPILDDAELVRIPCRSCPRERFVWVHKETREPLAYVGSETLVLSGESLPTAFNRLLNAPCDECQRVRDLDRDFIARRLAELAGESRDEPNREADYAPGRWRNFGAPRAALAAPRYRVVAQDPAAIRTERRNPGTGVPPDAPPPSPSNSPPPGPPPRRPPG